MRIDLHLGVHKTATTHLQRWWVRCAKVPGAASYAPMTEVREYLTPAAHTVERQGRAEAAADAARAWLGEWCARTDRLVLSDENLLGGCPPLFASQSLYTHALQRLSAVAEVLPDCELRIWLCVREYSSFIRSAYCEMLRSQPYRPFRMAYTGFNLDERSWCEVAADIQAAFPRAVLHVWRYESLDRMRPEVTSRLFDVPPALLPAADNQRNRQSISKVAVRLLDDIYKHAGEKAATDARASAERVLTGQKFQSFDPWDDDERAALEARYADDMQRLGTLPGLVLLG